MPSPIYEYQKRLAHRAVKSAPPLKYIEAYRERNKEKIDSCNKEKIICPICNKQVARYSMSAHKKSKKHLSTVDSMATFAEQNLIAERSATS